METPWFERHGLDDRGHGRHQPVAAPGDVLDEARAAGIVAEGGAELGDDLGEGVVGDELGAPDFVDEGSRLVTSSPAAKASTVRTSMARGRNRTSRPSCEIRSRVGSTIQCPRWNGRRIGPSIFVSTECFERSIRALPWDSKSMNGTRFSGEGGTNSVSVSIGRESSGNSTGLVRIWFDCRIL